MVKEVLPASLVKEMSDAAKKRWRGLTPEERRAVALKGWQARLNRARAAEAAAAADPLKTVVRVL